MRLTAIEKYRPVIRYSYFIKLGMEDVFPNDNEFDTPEEAVAAARADSEVLDDEHFGVLECETFDGGGRVIGKWKPCEKTTYVEDLYPDE